MPAAAPALSRRALSVGGSAVREILALTERPEVISFAGGLPAPEFFDAEGLRAAYDKVLGHDPGRALQYSTTEGDSTLRAAIAERLTGRHLPTEADDILITSGSQQALTLAATVLLDPGDTVLVEEPTYLAALQTFAFAGARVVPVPCDEDGVLPDALASLIASEKPKFLYVIPTFQNPTGRTMPLTRRKAVASVAASLGLWIVEDDPYGELRYRGSDLPPIAALPEAADRTVYLSSFSKVMAPGMRLGYLRAPAGLRRACVVAKQAADLHSSTIDQAAAAAYLTATDLDVHLAKVRGAYRERRDAMLAGLPAALPEGSTWNDPDGGMFIWAKLPEGYDAAALLPGVVGYDVAYVPGAPFYAQRPDVTTLRLSFVTQTPEEIAEGLRRLGRALGATS